MELYQVFRFNSLKLLIFPLNALNEGNPYIEEV